MIAPLPERPPVVWARVALRVQTALDRIHTETASRGSDGALHVLDGQTRVFPATLTLLQNLVRKVRPAHVVEVGCAYGYSTLGLAGALAEVGGLRHTVVDPHQTRDWKGIGFTRVREAGLGPLVDCREELSDLALPLLHHHGIRAQLVFIDGDHRFDGIVADIRNAMRILEVGGVMVLDDVWMASTRTAMSWLEANLPFKRVTVAHNLAVYQKTGPDRRAWNSFTAFEVLGTAEGKWGR